MPVAFIILRTTSCKQRYGMKLSEVCNLSETNFRKFYNSGPDYPDIQPCSRQGFCADYTCPLIPDKASRAGTFHAEMPCPGALRALSHTTSSWRDHAACDAPGDRARDPPDLLHSITIPGHPANGTPGHQSGLQSAPPTPHTRRTRGEAFTETPVAREHSTDLTLLNQSLP